MAVGLIALLFSAGAAGLLLWRMATGRGGGKRDMTMLKGVGFLAVASVLFAAKLWPLAFMVLLAAAAVTGIEVWRDRAIKAQEAGEEAALARRGPMGAAEAASILGVSADADAETVRAAHRKLIAALHPDKGGSSYLAAKINDARDALLKARGPVEPSV